MYRCLDQIPPHETKLERHLKDRYGALFGAEFDVLLYDLTSTYVEGAAEKNPMVRRGYSREGAYLLRSNLEAETAEELWAKYMQLTEAEASFRVQPRPQLREPLSDFALAGHNNILCQKCFICYSCFLRFLSLNAGRVAGGRAKLAGLKLFQRLGSALEPTDSGAAPANVMGRFSTFSKPFNN